MTTIIDTLQTHSKEDAQKAVFEILNQKAMAALSSMQMEESVDTLTEKKLDEMSQEEFDTLVEDFEQLDEISKKVLGSYVKAAAKDAKATGFDAGYEEGSATAVAKKQYDGVGAGAKTDAKAHKRLKNIDKAVEKLTK